MKAGSTPGPILDIKQCSQGSNNFPHQRPNIYSPLFPSIILGSCLTRVRDYGSVIQLNQ